MNIAMEKNEIITLTIEDISDEGLGIGHVQAEGCLSGDTAARADEGMAVFVKDSMVGDRLRVRIVKTKKTYSFGRIEEIISPGPDRVLPLCPAARSCGGCQIQEMSYPAQLRLKENKVRNNLRRIGGISLPDEECRGSDSGQQGDKPEYLTPYGSSEDTAKEAAVFCPIIGMDRPYHYRNKAEYPVGRDKSGRLIAGFYAGRTHTVVDGRNCVIGIEENQPILDTVLAWMDRFHVPEYQEETGKGLIRNIMIRCGFATGQIMVVIVVNADRLPHEKELVQTLQNTLAQSISPDEGNVGASSENTGHTGHTGRIWPVRRVTGIILNTNKARTNVILGRKNRTLWGSDSIEDRIGDVRYHISPLSFYQVNPAQTSRLYETALSFADLTGKETVWDLYCGIGTISLFLAEKARMVYGVEVVPDAIANAVENAKLNHIDNVRFICGKAEDVLPQEYKEHQIRADVIVVDPPRKGLEANVIDTIASMNPHRVVYVSCNSATLARDLKLFAEKGYKTVKVQPVDMFPHSVHVETVVLMSRVQK